jgi:hypothetical protein
MIVQSELQLSKCTNLVQCDVKIYFVDIFEENENKYMFFGEIHVHMIMEKHVIMYLKGTIYYGLRYISDHEIILQGYTHLDWEGIVTDEKSTFRCCYSM